jgi:hypothetical protein
VKVYIITRQRFNEFSVVGAFMNPVEARMELDKLKMKDASSTYKLVNKRIGEISSEKEQ